MENNFFIYIDNGHGNNTPGKRSPDGKLRESAYTREIASRVVSALRKLGYTAELLTPEVYDVRLLERVHRVNVKCQSLGKNNVLCVSIHCNAAGNGSKWLNATGWEIWTSPGKTKSDTLADHFVQMAKRHFDGQKIRECKQVDGERDKEARFTILTDTLCPAVLTENFFMDNKEDVKYLLSDEGKSAVVRCHVDSIISYIESIEQAE
jgi:N-acetylmuramoyl-L-alanine amidase